MLRQIILLVTITIMGSACASFEVRDNQVSGTLTGCPSGKFAITVIQELGGTNRPLEAHNVEVEDGKLSFRFRDRSRFDFSQPFIIEVTILDAPECGQPGTELNYSGSLERNGGVFEDVYHLDYSQLN